MNLLELNDGTIITDPHKIKIENKRFYEHLYASKEHELIDIDLNSLIPDRPKLDDTDKNKIEGVITYTEALNALKNMQNDKSPGTSGYSSIF